MLAALALGCAGRSGEAPAPAPTASPQDGSATRSAAGSLVELGDQALARGDLDVAQERYARALAARPGAAAAHTGLGRAALARGDLAAAQREFESALAREPDAARAHLGLGEIARRAGRLEAARDHAQRAVAGDPRRPEAHALLEGLTGRAPRDREPGPEDPLALVREHPYDPWARWRAGAALARSGHAAAARGVLEGAVWLADLDPESAGQAIALLREIEPAWRTRSVVEVHLFADQTLPAPGREFRLRLLVAAATQGLGEVLGTAFVPASIATFSSAGATDDLASIDAAFLAAARPLPASGIVAALTERPPPRRQGERLGQAEFLGRRLVARLQPGEGESRVLLHELLHLYGGVHVTDQIESIMNPSGTSRVLDPLNLRIVGAVRPRTFGRGGVEANVLPRVDRKLLAGLYVEALRVNLIARYGEIQQAIAARQLSRPNADALARKAGALDEHLADVCRFAAALQLLERETVEAVTLLEAAGVLYGPGTPRSLEARALADRVRRSAAAGAP